MSRTVADLTDDEIVDTIASFGVEGVDVDDEDVFRELIVRLRIERPIDMREVEFDGMFGDRSVALRSAGRLDLGHTGALVLSWPEWGKRLANRSAEDIARMLAGGA